MGNKKLTRGHSSENKLLGVCSGIGNFFGIDATMIRLGFVLLAFFGGLGIPVYIVFAIVMPEDEGRINVAYHTKDTSYEQSTKHDDNRPTGI